MTVLMRFPDNLGAFLYNQNQETETVIFSNIVKLYDFTYPNYFL